MPSSPRKRRSRKKDGGNFGGDFYMVNVDTDVAILVALIGLMGVVIGAVASGLMKYAMDRKNKLLQAYSQLLGRKFLVIQEYSDVLRLSLNVFYNIGLQAETMKVGKLCEAKRIEKENEYNVKKMEIAFNELKRDKENFWKTVGIINGITDDKNVDDLRELIRKEEESLTAFQQKVIGETYKGLPDYTRNGDNFSSIKWHENKNPELEKHIQLLGIKIDLFIDYIRENETKKHWSRFLS